jgi:hypothetical protein
MSVTSFVAEIKTSCVHSISDDVRVGVHTIHVYDAWSFPGTRDQSTYE